MSKTEFFLAVEADLRLRHVPSDLVRTLPPSKDPSLTHRRRTAAEGKGRSRA
jgi:hypothetical protein